MLNKLFKKLFNKNSDSPVELSRIGVDMHSHLIPNIDDGVKSIEESISIIKELHTLGFRKLITTPHIMSDSWKNTPEKIKNALIQVTEEVKKQNIDIEIEAAAEYYYDDVFEELIAKKKPDLLLFNENYLLFETSYFYPPISVKHGVFNLIEKGIIPVLAHPERYTYWHKEFSKYEELKEMGVLFQLNITSLTGSYSLQVKQAAEKLIDLNMYEFIGSDIHNYSHLRKVKNARTSAYLKKLLDSGKLVNTTL